MRYYSCSHQCPPTRLYTAAACPCQCTATPPCALYALLLLLLPVSASPSIYCCSVSLSVHRETVFRPLCTTTPAAPTSVSQPVYILLQRVLVSAQRNRLSPSMHYYYSCCSHQCPPARLYTAAACPCQCIATPPCAL